MKKKRAIISILTLAAAATLTLGAMSGCFKISVTSIEKSGTVGLVDYYTVTYSDGSTSQFSVTNGKDGNDAPALSVGEVYAEYKKTYGEELTFEDFCKRFLSPDAPQEENAALNSCLRSCVSVYSEFDKRKYSNSAHEYSISGGSGVVYRIEEDYTYILTNYHVVYNKDNYDGVISSVIHSYLYGSESAPDAKNGRYVYDNYAIPCEYVGGSIDYDVAVIKAKTEDVREINPQVCPVTVNYKYSVGDSTYAVGNPELYGISVTEGIVSVDSENISLKIDGTTRSYRSLRTDTAITHGNSGGGLFNMNGELIGLNNAGNEDVTSMNFAIPATALTGVADGIIHYNAGERLNYTKKTKIGVMIQASESRYVFDEVTGGGHIEETVTFTQVDSGKIASRAGIAVNDKLCAITVNGNKTEIKRMFEVGDLLLTVRAGDKISFEYERGGRKAESREVSVLLSDLEAVD